MSEFKGTGGMQAIWEVVEHSWSDTSLVCGDYTVATKSIYDEATEENQIELETEVQYNFLLISKSPEMLEMLNKVNDYLLSKGSIRDHEYIKEIEQLIKEATTI